MDDLNVLRGVAGSIDEGSTGVPNSLVKDGDLLGTIHSMIKHQGGHCPCFQNQGTR